MNVALVISLGLFAAEPESVELKLTAERVLHDGQAHRTTAEGAAQLTGPELAISADRIVYDRDRQVATAAGNVVARIAQGGFVVVLADVLTVRLDQSEVREVYVLDGRALSKTEVSAAALLAADTADAAVRVGVTNALLEGNHLVRDGPRWIAEDLELVPCACNPDEPAWSISSCGTTTIDTEAKRVSIVSPVVRVKRVPLLWLPWVSLPLTNRQSGLLMPRPNGTLLSGFSVEQPVFLTLGRSADVTLTPGFFTGGTGPFGVAGGRLGTEFRYVPSYRAEGRVTLGLLYDARSSRDPINPLLVGEQPRGLRGEGSWTHTQDFDHGLGVRVDARAHSDGYYYRDLTPDVIASTTGYLRSTATVFHRGADHLLSLEAVLRQDLTWGYDWLGQAARLPASTAPAFGPNPLHRLPALSFHLPTRPVWGALAVDLEVEAVRLAPLFGTTGDEGAAAREGLLVDEGGEIGFDCLRQRLYFPFAVSASCGITGADKTGQGDRVFQPGEREARDRLTVLPRLSVAATPGGAVSLSGFVGYRQTAWLGEVTGRTWQRGYFLLGATAQTELARTFADGALRHAITPVIEVRAVPAVFRGSSSGDPEPVPYDEVDGALTLSPTAPPTARVQALAELRQRVTPRGGSDVFRLDLGQGLDILAPEHQAPALSESYARLAWLAGWFKLQGQVRVDPTLPRLTRLSVRCELIEPGGLSAFAGWDHLLNDGNARTRRPIDLLFGPLVPATVTARANMVTLGLRWNGTTVGMRYDALFLDRVWPGDPSAVLTLLQHTLALTLKAPCDCFSVDLFATQRPRPEGTYGWPDFGANFTVTRFGSIGTGPR